MKKWIILLLCSLASLAVAEETNPFLDLEYYLNQVRYHQCDEFRSTTQVKIAILENSFPEFTEKDLETIPKDYELVLEENNVDASSPHGKFVTQLIYLITTRGGRCPEMAPKLYLIPAGGYTKLKQAIDKAIELDVDFVLHTNVFEYHGFGDGKGFINTLVNKALDAGITWINASGNFKEKIFQDYIRPSEEGWLKYFDHQDSIQIVCNKSKFNDSCKTRLVLQWDDFADDPSIGTEKDLDFAIFDSVGRRLNASTRIQSLTQSDSLSTTIYPYEAIEITLEPGVYDIKIKAQSNNFIDGDSFRLLLNSEFSTLAKQSPGTNSILPPADNPRVITVGANDSPFSSESRGEIKKPEFVLQSSLRDLRKALPKNVDGEFLGSSISSTIFTALAALIKTRFYDSNEDELLNRITERFLESANCHYLVDTVGADKQHLLRILDNNPNDVKVYPHEQGLRLLTTYDPYKVFGMQEVTGYTLGVGPDGNVGNVRANGLLGFLSIGGTLIDELRYYSVCKE